MKPLSPYAVLQSIVDDELTELTAETIGQHVFTERFVEAATVLSSYGDQHQQSNAKYCAYGLASWSNEKRQEFLNAFEVPGRVFEYLSNLPAWEEGLNDA